METAHKFCEGREAALWGEGRDAAGNKAELQAQPVAEDSGRGPGLLCSRVLPQGTAASTKNKLPSLITSMETVGAKALEDFADNIKVMSLLPLRRPARGAVGRATVTWLGHSSEDRPRCSPVGTHSLPFFPGHPDGKAPAPAFLASCLAHLCA